MKVAELALVVRGFFLAVLSLCLFGSIAEAVEEAGLGVASAEPPVSFARDVLPVLSANCFACHGPDEDQRQADLRLDQEVDAKHDHGDGAAVVAGEPDASTLMARLTSTDPSVTMPPPESGDRLEPEQIETIRRWIAQGAQWQRHWAFEPLAEQDGTLDDLVRAQLAQHAMKLQPAASPYRLARRLSLDLIGLPPTPEAANALAADPSPDAYERYVDELLESPHFGEHWARMWLDLARYADTKGYEKDLGRTMWPYRDWVINAFNADMPLGQFTTEQLAGDLLPNPTQSQLVATAFHRNTMANDEGGTDDEEFRVAAVKDRVNTTVQVWMGLTMGCAQCHSHKFDPISHEEYYRFYAIFNQTEDADRYDDAPRMDILTADQETRRRELQSRLAEREQLLGQAEQQAALETIAGDPQWTAAEIIEAVSRSGATLAVKPDQSVLVSGTSAPKDTYEVSFRLSPGRHTALRIEALPVELPDGGKGVGRNPSDPNFVVSELTAGPDGPADDALWKLVQPRADFSQDGWPVEAAIDGDVNTGWAVSPRGHERHVALFEFAPPIDLSSTTQVRVTISQQYGNGLTLAQFRLSTSQRPPAELGVEPDSPECQRLRAEIADVQKQLNELDGQIAKLPILRELAEPHQRETRIHRRGSFLDLGESVAPAMLDTFQPLPHSAPPNRLDVAHWLVSPENPLTPRVWANRVWAQLFGRGLVETEEDFGAMGSPPTNPELLDYLAVEYRDGGWSLKKLLKSIVMSDAYRQQSSVDADLLVADPRNELISRASRYRLSGEAIRDQSLAVSGLLSRKIGGPSVMPPQPAGLWRSTYNGQEWVDAEGEDRVRRGLYTYLKRTTPYPSFITFDGGSGEVCLVRRVRTNTPLQALVTLNDPVFLQASAALAERMVTEAADPHSRADRGFRLALIRPPRDGEVAPLVRLHQQSRNRFASEPQQAEALIRTCRGNPGQVDQAEFAAWIIVASAILNLDEFLTRN